MQRPPVPRAVLVGVVALLALGALPGWVGANHSWGNYHWARESNPFTLTLGDNVGTAWDDYLIEAKNDWSISTVLDTTIVAGGATSNECQPTSGRVEVCAYRYGKNGWLGLAEIWTSDGHITQATVKMNNSYFKLKRYNTPAWRRHVMCQEIAHAFGLDHQDETYNNANVGSCMDYTNDPDGGRGGAVNNDPSNEHPNQHDYEQLETIYAHLDGTTTVAAATGSTGAARAPGDEPREWGRALRHDDRGRPVLFRKDLGGGQGVFTWVFWAETPRGA